MHFTSPSRRAAGLLAATTIGLSTAVLSVPGMALAAPPSETTAVTDAPGSAAAGTTSTTAPSTTSTTAPSTTAPSTTATPSATTAPATPTTGVTPATETSPAEVEVAAAAPAAPVIADWVEVGDSTAEFRFTPGDPGDAYPVTWEYRLDGGTWASFTEGYTNNEDLTGTLTGLANLHEYTLTVRGVTSAGDGAESAPVTFMPFHPLSAPVGVTGTVGVTSIRISWQPAADGDQVASYAAFALPDGAQSSADLVTCETDASGRSCTVAVPAGLAYGVGVIAYDAAGNGGDTGFQDAATSVVPASATPAALPTASAPLTSSDADGTVEAGGQVTLTGDGYLPGSNVEAIAYSTPVSLGTVVAAANGTFSVTVTLPEDLADGTHHLVTSGVDPSGNPRYLVVEVTVTGGAAVARLASTADGDLAYTGFSALPYAGAGAVALLAGAGLIVASRRRAG